MKLSRRDLFKGLGGAVGMLGLGSLFGKKDAHASDKQKVDGKKVIVEWIGHGSFLFTAPSGKKILLDPWISTNPVCPQKYQQDNSFGNIDM
ncbi:MAG: twin-arginine translocation signal domain-containing protein, partial [Desulfobacteraceae bacterium]|nr:twin-arginine translocation signal domain-containing protein [Desulfobacteraceae bacterium]